MISLATGEERHVDWVLRVRRAEKRKEEDRKIAWELVIGHCHPSHLGELPPSPRVLDNQAWLLGLQPPRHP